ncbi:hypothetical protein H2200_008524 [Cladophialophora chaetospira]|uniref:AB hydrolase-1 domain-containing protein n=1 Tax=Cladophialophora chaetospira TaxID=386627 RepID=A0AA39CGP1_9EURO|nr:hypothetical protein H2200_008524 [Cladophialophora chaetospira]
MIGNSNAEYIWVVFWVVVLHSIGPISVAYCLSSPFLPHYLQLPRYLRYWALAETAFYILTYLYQKYHLERPALHPLLTSKEERNRLFDLCLNTTHDHAHYLSKWFMDKDVSAIKRENVKEFFQWAFLNTDVIDPIHDEELDDYVKKLEARMGTEFEHGRTDVKSLRLTLDKVNALHRSLIWYMFYRASTWQSIAILPPRPHAFVASIRSPSEDISYWYQAHTSKTELPVVFLHGIGVGLYPYMEFLKELNQGRKEEDGKIGILAVEILPISSRLTSPILQKEEMCLQIRAILHRHGFEKFVLVSHSYGSVITTHLLKTPDMARTISSVILVDPITILLNQPDVAYNFTRRRPRYASEWLLWYFGSKDMGVAHTLSRKFFWSENILWKEDVLDHRCVIFLGEKDSIINSSKVLAYLQDGMQVTSKGEDMADTDCLRSKPRNPSGSLNVVWCSGLNHGQVFDLPVWRARLKSEILKEAQCV